MGLKGCTFVDRKVSGNWFSYKINKQKKPKHKTKFYKNELGYKSFYKN